MKISNLIKLYGFITSEIFQWRKIYKIDNPVVCNNDIVFYIKGWSTTSSYKTQEILSEFVASHGDYIRIYLESTGNDLLTMKEIITTLLRLDFKLSKPYEFHSILIFDIKLQPYNEYKSVIRDIKIKIILENEK